MSKQVTDVTCDSMAGRLLTPLQKISPARPPLKIMNMTLLHCLACAAYGRVVNFVDVKVCGQAWQLICYREYSYLKTSFRRPQWSLVCVCLRSCACAEFYGWFNGILILQL